MQYVKSPPIFSNLLFIDNCMGLICFEIGIWNEINVLTSHWYCWVIIANPNGPNSIQSWEVEFSTPILVWFIDWNIVYDCWGFDIDLVFLFPKPNLNIWKLWSRLCCWCCCCCLKWTQTVDHKNIQNIIHESYFSLKFFLITFCEQTLSYTRSNKKLFPRFG